MCGIAGIISVNKEEVSVERLKKMTDVIAYRGPDGEGHWTDESGTVGLGHRRLSIIDLNINANQPMHYMGRYTIIFNGEIYNYIELKETLVKDGYKFQTVSDTEVLMALYDKYREKCLPFLDGMFAFALYDNKEKTTFCARDRYGEKPFYYSYTPGKHFLFASEMKSLWAGGVSKSVNTKMLFNYLAYGYVTNPANSSDTFFENCTLLPHSHYIVIDHTLQLKISKYYDIEYKNIDNSINSEKVKEKISELLYTSVSRRLRSDVPVGSSLSGGLDSSIIVCIISDLLKNKTNKQKTFSARFPGYIKDEGKYMQMVIDKTGVEPCYTFPDEKTFASAFDNALYFQEEPFGSTSILAQYEVMKLAKENDVTVLLDGQGADEICAGYYGYFKMYFEFLRKNNPSKYDAEYNAYKSLHTDNAINPTYTPDGGFKNNLLTQLKKNKTIYKYYRKHFSPLQNHLDKDFFNEYYTDSFEFNENFSSLNEMLYHYTMKSSLQTLMRYADRNSMAHSREVRLPFLYHELVDYLFTLPDEFKINQGWTKWILRESFKEILPTEICWRKDKIGYEPPDSNQISKKANSEAIKSNLKNYIKPTVLDGALKGNNNALLLRLLMAEYILRK